MKALDVLADVELNELEENIVRGNVVRWIQDTLIDRAADTAVKEYNAWLRDHPEEKIKLDRERLKEKVLNRLADEIIESWRQNGFD